jgi:hypothetical protein
MLDTWFAEPYGTGEDEELVRLMDAMDVAPKV